MTVLAVDTRQLFGLRSVCRMLWFRPMLAISPGARCAAQPHVTATRCRAAAEGVRPGRMSTSTRLHAGLRSARAATPHATARADVPMSFLRGWRLSR